MKSMLIGTSNAGLNVAAGSTTYFALGTCHLSGSTTEQNRKVRYYTAGILTKFGAKIVLNTTNGDSTVTVRKNGAAGNITVTIPAGLSGLFESSSTLQDSVAVGDDLDYQVVVSGSSGQLGSAVGDFTSFKIFFDTGLASVQMTKLVASSSVNFTVNSASRFFSLTGQFTSVQTTEDLEKFKLRFAATAKNMYVYASANTRAAATVMTLRLSGVDSSMTLTYPLNSGALLKEDTVNTPAIVAADDLNWVTTTGAGGGTLTLEIVSVEIHSSANFFVMPATIVGSFAPASGTTTYWGVGGFLTPDPNNTTTEANVQVRTSRMTVQSLGCRVGANGVTAISTLLIRLNSTNTTLTLNIGSGQTGYFEDISHSFSTSVDDLICYRLAAGSTGTTISFRGMTCSASALEDIEVTYPPSIPVLRQMSFSNKGRMGGGLL